LILLEHSRRVHFGRAPSSPEPGELPAASKWLHIANALICLPDGTPGDPGEPPVVRPGEVDWELVEVRWDHPAMLPRGGNAASKVPVRQQKAPKSASAPAKNSSTERDPNASAPAGPAPQTPKARRVQ
jgi:hypothetical protein